jgi:ACS family hexuronate transporter-like MFS transporter
VAYATGFVVMGWFIDRVGVRKGYAIAILIWVLSAFFHSTVTAFGGLGFFRFMLGLGEAGNYPSAVKTVAE